jgi:putative transposase
VDRQKFFTDFNAGCAAARCFEDTAILGDAKMLAWVLMPDHAHWLIHLGDKHTLDQVMNRIKSSSARMANRALKRQGKLWQAAYYDHAVREDEDLRKLARYLVANPMRAGISRQIHDYPFWNAVWV